MMGSCQTRTTATSVTAASGRSPAAQELVDDRARQRAADDVAAAAGAGLLGLDEADERLRTAWSARTAHELEQARTGLPQAWLAERRRTEAAERLREQARRALPAHARGWLALVALLVVIWALTTPGGYFWPIWPALGTGTCLAGQIAAARRPARVPG
jgi:hypothetical protein